MNLSNIKNLNIKIFILFLINTCQYLSCQGVNSEAPRPVVLWHGMGECLLSIKNEKK